MTIQLANLFEIEQRKQGVEEGLVMHLKSACTFYFHPQLLSLRQLVTAGFMQCGSVECSQCSGFPF